MKSKEVEIDESRSLSKVRRLDPLLRQENRWANQGSAWSCSKPVDLGFRYNICPTFYYWRWNLNDSSEVRGLEAEMTEAGCYDFESARLAGNLPPKIHRSGRVTAHIPPSLAFGCYAAE